jgi:isopentenyl phosphate kinase
MIFNYQKEGNIQKAIDGERIGTIVHSKTDNPS